MPTRLLHVLLTHQSPREVARMVAWWRDQAGVTAERLLVAHGGVQAEFDAISHPARLWVGDDSRLRTRDHQREKQNYAGVFARVARWLAQQPSFTHVHLAEYDEVPVVADIDARLGGCQAEERADVLAFRLHRIDGTSHSHYLYHAADPRFHPWFRAISCRPDPAVVLSIFGSGSLWTRESFESVAAVPEPFPIYLELWLPTVAHHLGFRVRPYPPVVEADWISNLGDRRADLDAARSAGAWSVHPVKSLWSAE